jgi:hypothetical protein
MSFDVDILTCFGLATVLATFRKTLSIFFGLATVLATFRKTLGIFLQKKLRF